MVIFARSRAGHDKGMVYLVLSEETDFVYLVNGTNRTLELPKKKRKKHVQIIKKLPIEVTECLSGGLTDITIKRAVKLYHQLNGGS